MPSLPPESAFATDDGAADPAVLAAMAVRPADPAAVQRALLGTRLLLPVVARAEAVAPGPEGRPVERRAAMATVSVLGPDGRRAALAFTGLAEMAAWDPTARPVPVAAVQAARAVLAEGAEALLLDVGGPHRLALAGSVLLALAEGRPALPAHADPQVRAAVDGALEGLTGLAGTTLERGAEADLLVTLVPAAGLTPDQVVGLAQEAGRRLAAVDLLRVRLSGGLDLAVRPG
jgi:hypothetical protein